MELAPIAISIRKCTAYKEADNHYADHHYCGEYFGAWA